MNPLLLPLFRRRSVRRYEARPVPADTIKDLLEAAMAAPSAAAHDPWRFIVVRRQWTLREMAEVLPFGQMLSQAPLAIVVCGELESTLNQELSYLLQDCSAAMQNLLLAAAYHGLGACWLGVHPREEHMDGLRSLLGIPKAVLPVACAAVGHPAESLEPRTRYDASLVHSEKW